MKTFQFAAIFLSIALLRDWTGQPDIILSLFYIFCTISFFGGLLEGRKSQ